MAHYYQSGLLGPHVQIVDSLLERLGEITSGDVTVPRVFVLRGESGCGKSRIIRELYERLRGGQPDPGFWPALPSRHLDDDGIVVPLGERKVIGPMLADFGWPAGALPSFSWWAFNCERANNRRALNILSEAREQFTVWLPPLAEAWAKHAGLWDRLLGKRHDIGRLLRDAAAGEITDAALEQLQQALNIAIPGIGTIASWAWQGAQASKRRIAAHRDLTSTVDLGQRARAERQSAAEQLAVNLRSLTHPRLPGLVVVEDAHLATPDMTDMLTCLAHPVADRPLMVILTSWPEGELRTTWDAWLETAEQARQAQIITIPKLDSTDLIALIRRYAPGTRDPDAALLASAMPSPLLLELWLTMGETQRQIRRHHGSLPVDASLLTKLPTGLADVYRERWRELTPQVKRALTIAIALTAPSDPVPAFLPDVVAEAAAAVNDFADQRQVAEGLALAADPAAWTVITGGVEAFREAPLATQARDALTMDSHTQQELRAAAIKQLRDWITERLAPDYWLSSTPETDLAADWLNDLAGEKPKTAAEIGACWLRARNLAADLRYKDAIKGLSNCLNAVEQSTEDTLYMREHIANWTGNTGLFRDAVDLYSGLVPHFTTSLGDNHPDTLAARSNQAFVTGQAGRYEEALTRYAELIPALITTLGGNHPNTLTARSNQALFMGQAGHYEEAVARYAELIPVLTNILGGNHPDTFVARSNQAGLIGEAGRYEDALAVYAELIPALTTTLGVNHPNTLAARSSQAGFMGRAGRYEDDLTRYAELIPALTTTLGGNHPDTLTARSNQAGGTGQAGRHAESVALYAELIPILTATLGDNHPNTLTARNSQAGFMGQAGRYEEAVALYTELIPILTAALGDNHPNTLTARCNQALFMGQAGHYEEAVALYTELIPILTAALSDNHPNTLTARCNQALLTGQAGHHEEALALYTELIPILTTTLRDNHPNTLTVRGNQALFMGRAGHHEEAVALYAELIPDLTTTLGDHHPDTLTARSSQAGFMGRAGRHEEALARYAELIPALTTTLGGNHPSTLAARSNQASTKGRAGHHEEAVALYSELIPDLTAALGDNHPDTLIDRNDQAFVTGQAGHYEEALALYAELIPDLTTTLGDNHPDTLVARSNQAGFIGEAGRYEDALALYAELIPILATTLGGNHPNTLVARRNQEGLRRRGQQQQPHLATGWANESGPTKAPR